MGRYVIWRCLTLLCLLSCPALAQIDGGAGSSGVVDLIGPWKGAMTFTRASSVTDPNSGETLPPNISWINAGVGARADGVGNSETLTSPLGTTTQNFSVFLEYDITGTPSAGAVIAGWSNGASNYVALQDGGSGTTPQIGVTLSGSTAATIALTGGFATGVHDLAIALTATGITYSLDGATAATVSLSGSFTPTTFGVGAPGGSNGNNANVLFRALGWWNGALSGTTLATYSGAGYFRTNFITSPTQYYAIAGGQSLMQGLFTGASPLYAGNVLCQETVYLMKFVSPVGSTGCASFFGNSNWVHDGTGGANSTNWTVKYKNDAHGSSATVDTAAPTQVDPTTSANSISFSGVSFSSGATSITIAGLTGLLCAPATYCGVSAGGTCAADLPTKDVISGWNGTTTVNLATPATGTCTSGTLTIGYPNYWVNTQDNHATTGYSGDTGSTSAPTPGFLLRYAEADALAACGFLGGFHWSQGTADQAWVALSSTNRGIYKAMVTYVFNSMRSSACLPLLPILIHHHQNDFNLQTQTYMNILEIQDELAQQLPAVYIAVEEWPWRKGITHADACGVTSGSNVFTTASTGDFGIGQRVTSLAGLFPNSISTQFSRVSASGGGNVTLLLTTSGAAANATGNNASDTCNVFDSTHLYPLGGTPHDSGGGTTYDGVSGYYAKALRDARTTAFWAGYPTVGYHAGPKITGIQSVSAGATTIDLIVQEDGGTALTNGDGSSIGSGTAPDFYVLNNGVAKTVTASYIGPTDIRLTLGSGTFAAGSLSVAYPLNPNTNYVVGPDQWIFDNASPYTMPLQPTDPDINPAMSVTVH